MNLIRVTLVALLFCVAGCSFKTPEEELKSAISEMITLLEQGEHQKFLEHYYDCDINNMWKRGGGMEAWARQFKGRYSDRTLGHLRKAQSLTPDITKNKKIALFLDDSFPVPLGFLKVDRWRLMDPKTVLRVINYLTK